MKRKKITVYIIGVGIAGAIYVFPYFLIMFRKTAWQIQAFFFLVPLVWGLWNLLYTYLRHPLDIGGWGALLGFILALAFNVLIFSYGHWSFFLLLGLVGAPVIYSIIWKRIIEPLNNALSLET